MDRNSESSLSGTLIRVHRIETVKVLCPVTEALTAVHEDKSSQCSQHVIRGDYRQVGEHVATGWSVKDDRLLEFWVPFAVWASLKKCGTHWSFRTNSVNDSPDKWCV